MPRIEPPVAPPLPAAFQVAADFGDDPGAAVPWISAFPALPSDVAIGDVDDLLSAVKARLSATVSGPLSTLPELRLNGEARRIQGQVRECLAALDQLHMTLRHEFGRRRQLELEAFEARAALARAQAELAGTQAGERRARHLARHDTLTALPNRSCFRERLDQALARAGSAPHPVAVMYLDLDGFKPVNDAHGHAAGDELLRIVASRLTRAVRGDDLVGRPGG